jgi:hypothetical protein
MGQLETGRRKSGKGPPRYPDDIKKSAIEMFARSRADFNTGSMLKFRTES